MARSKILLLYTGGTIGMVKHPETGTLKAFNFDAIAEQIPELKLLDCDTECISFETPIDSSDIDPSLWVTIVDMIETNYASFDGFVILHGSDTMSYSAAALSFMCENLSKPIIFTGSQLPIGDLRTDAKENLITSIQLAALKDKGKAIIQEVGLYFEYKLYRGNRTTKINAAHFEAFESLNYAPLAQSGVSLEVSRSLLLKPQKGKHTKFHKKMDHSVGVLKLFPGISPSFVRAVLFSEGLKAIVLETYGAGNAPTATWFIAILSEAIQNGLIIVNVTQCSGGSVLMGHYEASKALEHIQLLNGKDISTEAALAKLMYMLGSGVSKASFKTIFETSLRGEMQ
ncbi:MAG: asparaginase [Flavobacteriaceae bacterium]|nr:asparaginase [Flavobacteriaceae bacterium]MDG1047645.1 asparaginase [Flavobacteriaceae bacterium]MDG1759527.1 asparaginase [Flavobacteriaceae bacterium]MDG2317750.1 asparaginase [Flavobacteriaceae bacterium]